MRKKLKILILLSAVFILVGAGVFVGVTKAAYIDDNLKEGFLADYDEEGYSNAVSNVSQKDNFTATVSDGSMKLSSNVSYGDVYKKISIPKSDFDFSQTSTVTVKVKVDRLTDYVKITASDGEVAGASYFLEADTWYEIVVDPLRMGYNKGSDMILIARAKNGLNLEIDEITYVANKISANYNQSENFDSEDYLGRVFQNAYHGETFGGTHLEGGYSDFVIDQNELVVTTKEKHGGFTYAFQQSVNTSNVSNIKIALNHEKDVQKYVVGIIYDGKKCSTYKQEYDAGINNTDTVLVLNASDFKSQCGSTITGIWLGVIDDANDGNVLHVKNIVIE